MKTITALLMVAILTVSSSEAKSLVWDLHDPAPVKVPWSERHPRWSKFFMVGEKVLSVGGSVINIISYLRK